MFTGLVQAVGTVREATPHGASLRLAIDTGNWAYQADRGDSVCVNGVCLTHTASASDGVLTFDAVAETLQRTTLGALRVGDRVNLEHALRATSLIGGHFVQGHIDAVGTVVEVRPQPGDWRVRFTAPPEAMECMVTKGSVCVDGVSLTITGVERDTFGVTLIPETLDATTLRALRAGDRVKLETDMIARTVVEFLRRRGR